MMIIPATLGVIVQDDNRIYHVNVCGPGHCECGGHRPSNPCGHVRFVRAEFKKEAA